LLRGAVPGAEDVAVPDARVRIGRAQDVLPRAYAEDELHEMQRDRKDECRPGHGRRVCSRTRTTRPGNARTRAERPGAAHAADSGLASDARAVGLALREMHPCSIFGLRVAFLVCPPYQGATLLALLLNNHSQISALGECSFPARSFGFACACGQLVIECDFWHTVQERLDPTRSSSLSTLFPALPWPLSRRQLEWSRVRLSPNARLNRIVGRFAAKLADIAVQAAWRLRRRPVEDFVRSYRSFYELVLDMHGTSTFVDGYKSWRKAALLGRELQPANDVRIIHLVRDPRGFEASRRRHLQTSSDPRESAWLWADLHRRMESLRTVAPYRLLRYEDLALRPDAEMRKLFQFLGVEPESVVAAPKYPAKHHIVGNDMVRGFSGSVSPDTRWRDELSTADQRTVLASAGPLAARLGYTEHAAGE
jgi:hypothetical protein